MNKPLVILGRALGLIGVGVCLVAILARAAGYFWIVGMTSGSVLQGGIAAIIFAVLCFVAR
jgi:hypothetical protein